MSATAKRRRDAADEGAPQPLPVPVRTGRVQRRQMLVLTGMDDDVKGIVWDCIKRRRPALAELLKSKRLEALRDEFNGKVRIALD